MKDTSSSFMSRIEKVNRKFIRKEKDRQDGPNSFNERINQIKSNLSYKRKPIFLPLRSMVLLMDRKLKENQNDFF